MKHDTAQALALDLDAQCLRITGDMQGAASLQSKADAIRAGTYQELPPRDLIVELADAQANVEAAPFMHDCTKCGRIAAVLIGDEYFCRRCSGVK